MSCSHSQEGVYIACVHCDIEHVTLAERERIIKLLEARCLWLIHLDRLAEANELSLQIALIKGENK